MVKLRGRGPRGGHVRKYGRGPFIRKRETTLARAFRYGGPGFDAYRTRKASPGPEKRAEE